jgi:hypothetical protein
MLGLNMLNLNMHGLTTTKTPRWGHLLRSLPITLAAFCVLFATTRANAGCGDVKGARSGVAFKMPFLAQLHGSVPERADAGQTNSSIVGLWHVTYSLGGEFFFESFDQWHSDGTELENANLIPSEGNVCVGVWKQIGVRTVKLNHTGWNFDANGNPTGTFTIAQTNTVSPHGDSYKGTFDYKIYDVDGNLLQELTGTQTAVRITVN